MKNYLFNSKLYLQGLKQLSTIAIDALAILLVIGVFGIIEYDSIEGFDLFIPIYAHTAYLTFIPIMAIYILRYFHKRNSSDFYFSIPNSIACTSFSYTASVITYALAISALIIPTLSDHYSPLDKIIYFIGLFTTNLLVIGAIYLAWSLTNTIFSHIVVSGLILILPQTIISFISDCIYNLCCFLDKNNRAIFLDGKLNLLTHNWVLTYEHYDYVPGIIYTLILTSIYFMLAIILSKTKRSENAGSETGNRIVQTITRCIVATFICLPAISAIVDNLYYNQPPEYGYTVFGIIFLYFIAICVYFIYEFISTRTIKTFKSALLGLPLLVLINILIIITILITCNSATSFTPDADEIDYVQFTGETQLFGKDNSYYSSIINKITIKDIQTKNAISDELKSNIYIAKNSYTFSKHSSYFYLEDHINLKVLICSNGKKYYRHLKIYEGDYYNMMANAAYESEEFIKLASSLPESKCIYDILDVFKNPNKDYSKEDLYELYEVYRSELATLSIDEQREIIKFAAQLDSNDSELSYEEFEKKYGDKYIITVAYETNIEENINSLFINITEKTPKAYALCQKIMRRE